MGKRQDFIDLYKSGKGTRQKYIDLSGHGFRSKSLAVPIDPFRELMIYEMLMSGALPSELKHGGIASLAPRSRYDAGNRVWPPEGARPDGSFDPPQIPETLLQTMPILTPELLRLMREHKKRQGLARILEV